MVIHIEADILINYEKEMYTICFQLEIAAAVKVWRLSQSPPPLSPVPPLVVVVVVVVVYCIFLLLLENQENPVENMFTRQLQPSSVVRAHFLRS